MLNYTDNLTLFLVYWLALVIVVYVPIAGVIALFNSLEDTSVPQFPQKNLKYPFCRGAFNANTFHHAW